METLKLLKPTEVAKIINCKPGTVYKWASLGQIPGAVKIQGLLRFHEDDVRTWIARQTEEFQKKSTRHLRTVNSLRRNLQNDKINTIVNSVIESSRPVKV